MKKTLYALALTSMVVSLICFIACSKDSSTDKNGTNPNNIPPEVTVTASLQGRVLDENGVPVQGAAVSSGVATTTTDVNGVFTFSRISMSSRFGFVKVVKQGYFTGSRSIITNGGASNYVSIQLMPRTSKGSFPASSGGTVVVQAGDTAVFPVAGIVNASTNVTYTGNVNVFATYLDPTASDLYKYMPGDLRGVGTDGKETALQSFGMLAVEMEGDAGEKLQLAAGKKATLTWAIPTALQATAPATIPLWYFNDSSGRWIEEGSALRVGNSYIGQVGHFSYWNCDASSGTVNFKVHVKDQHGNPLAYSYIQFESQGWGTRGGYTDIDGFSQGLIPKGQTLVMQVVTECGNMLGGINIGPALADQDLGTVVVTVDASDLTLTGTVVDCSNNPVDSGYVNVLVDGLTRRAAVAKGAWTLSVSRCYSSTAPVALTPVDLAGQAVGAASTITASSGSVDAGELSACGNAVTQLITLNFNGATYSWTAPPDDFKSQVTPYGTNQFNDVITATAAGSSNQAIVTLNDNPTNTGQYPGTLWLSVPGTHADYANAIQWDVSTFGPVGGYITGTLSGKIFDTVARVSYPLTGNMKIKRTQ
ncbi:MAG TPA: carboxypeptidase-like regulatory domain-containing protein [Puia sp.]|nr:carboxypeptidase-like regulatory domain-containing protein [Puia sp.]